MGTRLPRKLSGHGPSWEQSLRGGGSNPSPYSSPRRRGSSGIGSPSVARNSPAVERKPSVIRLSVDSLGSGENEMAEMAEALSALKTERTKVSERIRSLREDAESSSLITDDRRSSLVSGESKTIVPVDPTQIVLEATFAKRVQISKQCRDLDRDKFGTLSSDDIMFILHSLGIDATEEHVMMMTKDYTKHGRIDFMPWLADMKPTVPNVAYILGENAKTTDQSVPPPENEEERWESAKKNLAQERQYQPPQSTRESVMKKVPSDLFERNAMGRYVKAFEARVDHLDSDNRILGERLDQFQEAVEATMLKMERVVGEARRDKEDIVGLMDRYQKELEVAKAAPGTVEGDSLALQEVNRRLADEIQKRTQLEAELARTTKLLQDSEAERNAFHKSLLQKQNSDELSKSLLVTSDHLRHEVAETRGKIKRRELLGRVIGRWSCLKPCELLEESQGQTVAVAQQRDEAIRVIEEKAGKIADQAAELHELRTKLDELERFEEEEKLLGKDLAAKQQLMETEHQVLYNELQKMRDQTNALETENRRKDTTLKRTETIRMATLRRGLSKYVKDWHHARMRQFFCIWTRWHTKSEICDARNKQYDTEESNMKSVVRERHLHDEIEELTNRLRAEEAHKEELCDAVDRLETLQVSLARDANAATGRMQNYKQALLSKFAATWQKRDLKRFARRWISHIGWLRAAEVKTQFQSTMETSRTRLESAYAKEKEENLKLKLMVQKLDAELTSMKADQAIKERKSYAEQEALLDARHLIHELSTQLHASVGELKTTAAVKENVEQEAAESQLSLAQLRSRVVLGYMKKWHISTLKSALGTFQSYRPGLVSEVNPLF